MRRFFVVASMFLLSATCVPIVRAQEPRDGDAVMERWLANETSRLSGGELSWVTSREEWEAQRDERKEQFLDMLGLWPIPEKTPLKAVVTGALERDGFRVEKVHFQSKPGLYVTGNLYLPHPLPKDKLPTVLYVCGHSGRGRDGNKTAFQHHGSWFATHGYACLIIDTLQLGEVAGIHHGTYQHQRWWWQSAGYTSAGVECWNGVRAIDYLVTRPEVDAERIAVTGISGGGAATFWITAADERVKVCVPVSGMSDLQSYVTDKVVNGHCDCMFLYNAYRWEWSTIAALIAPRPMLFENSGHDTIFPMPANERIRTRLERLYNFYQKKPGDLFDIGVTPGGHEDNLELRLMAYRFINRHLKNDNAEVQEPQLPKIPGKELRVFPEESDLPADSLNSKIDETFVPVAKVTPPANAAQFEEWSNTLRAGLLNNVFRDWPDEIPAAEVRERRPDGRTILQTDDATAVLARVTPGAAPAKNEIKPKDNPAPKRLWVVILDADDPEGEFPAWAKGKIPADAIVTCVSPRGFGAFSAYTRKNPPNYVERSHALLGRTVDTLRVWDIQAVARWLHESEGGELLVGVVGRGQTGILGAYAALFDNCIAEVLLINPPASHREGPIFLNVLRTLDIPDALGMLAPRRLTLIGPSRPLRDKTTQIYKNAGHVDRLVIRDE
ncbi:MAG: prolyl oligopeptidase family serine peptidase [Planctomycetota bacterium]|nr:prolyl oligopeptidase family serine peptidase [Planctomycetota bacterium]